MPDPTVSFSQKRSSIFSRTALDGYIDSDKNSPFDHVDRYKSAINAFVNESRAAFALGCGRSNSAKRYEDPHTYIVKLLLAIGLLPRNNGFAVIAKLVETLCMCPQIGLNVAITRFAQAHGATAEAVTRIIEKNINVYDAKFIRRLTCITQSAPMTVKDVICDLAVYVRARYFDGTTQNE